MFRSTFGQTYRHLSVAESTQDELREDDPEGTIVVAEAQSAGRGRQGRAWVAPAGRALLMSVLLRPPVDRPPAELSLVAGVVVAATIERETGLPTGVKWPNDVLIGRAKTAGILAEKRGEILALGIGINVNQTREELPADTRLEATSLRAAGGREHDRAFLLARIAEGLETAYRSWLAAGLGSIAADLADRDVLRGRSVRVGEVEGTAAGIGPDGALLLDTAAGRRGLVAGEVKVTW